MEPLSRPTPPRSLAERARAWVEWFGIGRLVAASVATVIVCAGAVWLVRTPPPATEASLPRATATSVAVDRCRSRRHRASTGCRPSCWSTLPAQSSTPASTNSRRRPGPRCDRRGRRTDRHRRLERAEPGRRGWRWHQGLRAGGREKRAAVADRRRCPVRRPDQPAPIDVNAATAERTRIAPRRRSGDGNSDRDRTGAQRAVHRRRRPRSGAGNRPGEARGAARAGHDVTGSRSEQRVGDRQRGDDEGRAGADPDAAAHPRVVTPEVRPGRHRVACRPPRREEPDEQPQQPRDGDGERVQRRDRRTVRRPRAGPVRRTRRRSAPPRHSRPCRRTAARRRRSRPRSTGRSAPASGPHVRRRDRYQRGPSTSGGPVGG